MANRKRPTEPDLVSNAGTRVLIRRDPKFLRPADRLVLQVAEIQRYALDEEFFASTGETIRPLCGDAFDVTLSDGVNTLRCLLSTALNQLVYHGWLRESALVRVFGWRKQEGFTSTGEARPPFVILTHMARAGANQPQTASDPFITVPDVVPAVWANGIEPTPVLLDPTVVTKPPAKERFMHMAMRPLLGKRQYYLRLDSDEVLATPLWSQCNDEQARDFPLELEALPALG